MKVWWVLLEVGCVQELQQVLSEVVEESGQVQHGMTGDGQLQRLRGVLLRALDKLSEHTQRWHRTKGQNTWIHSAEHMQHWHRTKGQNTWIQSVKHMQHWHRTKGQNTWIQSVAVCLWCLALGSAEWTTHHKCTKCKNGYVLHLHVIFLRVPDKLNTGLHTVFITHKGKRQEARIKGKNYCTGWTAVCLWHFVPGNK